LLLSPFAAEFSPKFRPSSFLVIQFVNNWYREPSFLGGNFFSLFPTGSELAPKKKPPSLQAKMTSNVQNLVEEFKGFQLMMQQMLDKMNGFEALENHHRQIVGVASHQDDGDSGMNHPLVEGPDSTTTSSIGRLDSWRRRPQSRPVTRGASFCFIGGAAQQAQRGQRGSWPNSGIQSSTNLPPWYAPKPLCSSC
jgi:hypothetical protein